MTRYGVHAGTEGVSMGDVLAFWQTVESLGFDWISVWDHFYPIMGSGGAGSFESSASQAALATTTSRVRIGVLVYSVGYRHPAVLANAISTTDHLSGGRAERRSAPAGPRRSTTPTAFRSPARASASTR